MKKLNLFEWTLIIVISVLNIVVFIINKEVDTLGIVSSITGIICVVMTAKGHISCYYYGLINIVTYVVIAYQAALYGEVMLNGLYYLPMQFVGIYFWNKNKSEKEGVVKAGKISIIEILIYSLLSVIGVILYGNLLKHIGGNQPFVDSFTTILSLISMYLSVKRFKEQWILWILVDIVTVYMWVVAFMNGEPNSLVMVLMWIGYLVNAFYGYINWHKMEKELENV